MFEWDVLGTCDLEDTVVRGPQITFCHLKRLGTGIEKIQPPNPRCNQLRPPAAAASKIEPNGIRRKFLPREDVEIIVKQTLQLIRRESRLIKSRPFVTEAIYDMRIDIRGHCLSMNL